MRVFKKSGDTLEILCRAGEIDIKIGEYLLLYEGEYNMIAQVLDVSYVDIPGILEDLLRDLTIEDSNGRTVFDPYNISSLGLAIREARVLKCKIRGISRSSVVEPNSGWLPSRFNTSVRKAGLADIQTFQKTPIGVEIHLGEVLGQQFTISAKTLDGSLTIVTGKKESGKSHLAKLLVEGLARHGAVVVVFDVNGEYVNLGRTVDGGESPLARSLKILVPGKTLTTSLEEMGLKCFMDILEHVYATPSTSCREMARIWATLERGGKPITLTNLIEYVTRAPMNESVREALVSRLQSISHTGFINDDGEPTRLEKILQPRRMGAVVVVDLSQLLPSTRRLTVEYLLTTISKLLPETLSDLSSSWPRRPTYI